MEMVYQVRLENLQMSDHVEISLNCPDASINVSLLQVCTRKIIS